MWAAPWLALAYSRLRDGGRSEAAPAKDQDRAAEADVTHSLTQAEGGGCREQSYRTTAPPLAQRSPASRKDRTMHFLVAALPILLGTARLYAPEDAYPVSLPVVRTLYASLTPLAHALRQSLIAAP